jgi:catechol 2,3-dioxygenase-like lactoylglutathione lyase family enzyme
LVVIRSANIERARTFYAEMGLFLRQEAHGAGPLHYVSNVCGLVFEIYPLAHDQAPTTSVRLGFQVDSVDELVPSLVGAGGSLIVGPRDVDGGRHAVVRDPDGHSVEMFAPSGGHTVGRYLGKRLEGVVLDRPGKG